MANTHWIKYIDSHGNVSYIKSLPSSTPTPKVKKIKVAKSKSRKPKVTPAQARAKRWSKSYKFSRKSPLAKRLRKLF